ncbi:MAG TPA: ATP-binding protein [Candidatus Tumulicola sp.]|nr:ATP-binding protein [Candidatus Tumulicola sp.]
MLPRTLWQFRSDEPSEALVERPHFIEALRRRFGDGVDVVAAEIVFTELVGNVMRHAPGPIEIHLVDDEPASLEVIDSGPGFDFKPNLPPPSAECGRGLYIVSQLSRDVSTRRRDGTAARVIVTLMAYRKPPIAGSNGATDGSRRPSNGKG